MWRLHDLYFLLGAYALGVLAVGLFVLLDGARRRWVERRARRAEAAAQAPQSPFWRRPIDKFARDKIVAALVFTAGLGLLFLGIVAEGRGAQGAFGAGLLFGVFFLAVGSTSWELATKDEQRDELAGRFRRGRSDR